MKERLVVCGILYCTLPPPPKYTYRGEATVSLVGNTRPPPHPFLIFGPFDTVYKVHRGLLNGLSAVSYFNASIASASSVLGARTVCNISGVSSQIFKGLSHETYCAFVDINEQTKA
jgi:hypothetical protein